MARLFKQYNIGIALLQETHTENEQQFKIRGDIHGYVLMSAVHHPKYGIATYVRSDFRDISTIQSWVTTNIFISTIKASNNYINIYKPPNVNWPPHVLPTSPHPAIYAGDFNSHHTAWKYDISDNNGTDLMDWIELNNLHLIFNPKDIGTFHSARWKKYFNPDLYIVSSNSLHKPLQTTRTVMSIFPHSQHPVIYDLGIKIPLIKSLPKPRWNFIKVDWDSFAHDLDETLKSIPASSENYNKFAKTVIEIAKKHVPRGYRKAYTPCWTEESAMLYKELHRTNDPRIADKLLKSLLNFNLAA